MSYFTGSTFLSVLLIDGCPECLASSVVVTLKLENHSETMFFALSALQKLLFNILKVFTTFFPSLK